MNLFYKCFIVRNCFLIYRKEIYLVASSTIMGEMKIMLFSDTLSYRLNKVGESKRIDLPKRVVFLATYYVEVLQIFNYPSACIPNRLTDEHIHRGILALHTYTSKYRSKTHIMQKGYSEETKLLSKRHMPAENATCFIEEEIIELNELCRGCMWSPILFLFVISNVT